MDPQRLHEIVERQAQRRPDEVAVVDGERTISYGELQQLSWQLAHVLQSSGLRSRDRVALWLDKSIEAIVGMLGTLAAGGVYVPLDPASPASRVRKVLVSCEPAFVLVAGKSAAQLEETLSGDRAPGIGWLDESAEPPEGVRIAFSAADLRSAPTKLSEPAAGRDEAAHILFTSGSTGQPKGVIITHRNVLEFVEWANGYFGAAPDDRHSAHSPFFFDLSTFDIYGTFHAGAELHIVPQQLNLLPNKLAEFIRERRLTQWFSVPSILNYMAKFDVVSERDFPDLRRVLWCGEVFPTASLRYWMKKLPEVPFTNLYGPTEATIASSFYTVPACPASDREEIPIGRACAGETLLVLDEALQPVPVGQVGDLYIGGVGLSAGYWRDPGKTAQAFIELPGSNERTYKTGDLARIDEDGLVYFLGRADTQIKSRGYRIELGEIESALQSIERLHESAVVAVATGGFEGHAICCGYAPQPGQKIDKAALRTQLRELLPSYMIPQRWREYESLPKTANGKIDRKSVRADFEAERSPV